MVGGQPDVLIEGETGGLRKGQLADTAARGQLVVDRQRRGAGGQAEYGVGPALQQVPDGVRGQAADRRGVRRE